MAKKEVTNGNAVITIVVPLTELKPSEDGNFLNFKNFKTQRGSILVGTKEYPVILSYNQAKKATIVTMPLKEKGAVAKVEVGIDPGLKALM